MRLLGMNMSIRLDDFPFLLQLATVLPSIGSVHIRNSTEVHRQDFHCLRFYGTDAKA